MGGKAILVCGWGPKEQQGNLEMRKGTGEGQEVEGVPAGKGQAAGGGGGSPPPFGAPDAVGQQEDEDDEQEAHDGSQACQPRLQAAFCGWWKAERWDSETGECVAPTAGDREKGAKAAQTRGPWRGPGCQRRV